MQDIRLRTGIALVLSIAAFATINGAVLAFIWWLCFSCPWQKRGKAHRIIPVIVLIVFFSLVLELSGGGGLSYGLRMVVVVLIGTWVYAEYRNGDFLNLGTWLFKNRTGFELGMIAEMGVQSLDLMISDFTRIRLAQELKGTRWGLRCLVPAGIILVHDALARAGDMAELMAVRGYCHGGTWCPEFVTTTWDVFAGLAALCMGIIAFVPVSEFFILYH